MLVVHIFVSVSLIISILLQSGKGADIGAVFGGAGGQALFGGAGPADFLNKATRILAVVFLITSLTLGYFMFEKPTKSIMDSKPKTANEQPVQPVQPVQPMNPVIPNGK